MKLEDQVCSLELAKKLKELNCPQESLFTWQLTTQGYFLKQYIYLTTPSNEGSERYSAYTVAELWGVIEKAKAYETYKAYKEVMDLTYDQIVDLMPLSFHNIATQPDISAQMLIYLLENKLLTL